MPETSPEMPESLPGVAIVERQQNLMREMNELNEILHARMTQKVKDVLEKNGAGVLEIRGCQDNRLFLAENINVRTGGDLVRREIMDAIKSDLRDTDCICKVGLTTDDQYGLTQIVDFNVEKLDA